MAVELTDKAVAAMKPGATRIEVWDAKVAGLGLRIAPSGEKVWTLRYRVHGQQRRLKLGVYGPDRMGLAAARKLANQELRKVDGNIDPQAEREAAVRAAEAAKQAEALAKRDSIARLCEDYIERHAKRRKRTWRDDQSKLACEVLPHWRDRPVTSITRGDCRDLVNAIDHRGAPIYANRIAALLSRLFRFAEAEWEITKTHPTWTNPAWRLPKPGVEVEARPDGEREKKPYDDDEIRAIWTATEDLDPAPRAIYRLGLITGQRPGEISDLEWPELDGDWWTIPGRRAKNGREHRVFLTALAQDAIKAVIAIKDEPRVFARWRGKRQLGEVNTQVFATVRARLKPRHAMRDTVATGLAACGVDVEDIAKVLNHRHGPRITSGYNAYSYDKEKRLALAKWSRRLAAILEERPETGKVRAFKR